MNPSIVVPQSSRDGDEPLDVGATRSERDRRDASCARKRVDVGMWREAVADAPRAEVAPPRAESDCDDDEPQPERPVSLLLVVASIAVLVVACVVCASHSRPASAYR